METCLDECDLHLRGLCGQWLLLRCEYQVDVIITCTRNLPECINCQATISEELYAYEHIS